MPHLTQPASNPSTLPQADATTLVDCDRLEQHVRDTYSQVTAEPDSLPFETGRSLALRLGYPGHRLAAIPADAVDSFAGVGYHFDLVQLIAGEAVLDLGSGSGMDAFYTASVMEGSGRVVGVDFTEAQVEQATFLRDRDGFDNVEFVQAGMDELPFEDGSFDVVISNGAINLAPAKNLVFAEAARVLRRGGRLVVADMVSATPLEERTRRNIGLWTTGFAGAIPRDDYADAIEDAGFRIASIRRNHYRFMSERTRQACRRFGIGSTTMAAVRQMRTRTVGWSR